MRLRSLIFVITGMAGISYVLVSLPNQYVPGKSIALRNRRTVLGGLGAVGPIRQGFDEF